MNFFKKLFRKKEANAPDLSKPEFSEEEFNQDYELKMAGLESLLGESHDLVGHAIIPFQVGGTVDMYYFPNHLQGTGFATMELLDPHGKGPRSNRLGTYELVAFTKLEYDSSDSVEESTPFDLIERAVCGIFTTIGNYSTQAVLNPRETLEIPGDEGEENTCIVLDLYEPEGKKFMVGDREHHLLLCLQVFRTEMEYAMENGSGELLKLLKAEGHWPYSDLDRESVI